ncbi:MAG: hypothetical protein ACJ0QX_00305 [Gammaproteobacteria bacterium]|tara:strand:- start:149 stop:1666 length:1518 start_codon:yes stop_codon:yes gene_type:complete
MKTSFKYFFSTLLFFIYLFIVSDDYFVGDLSHLTLNSSFNIFKGYGYTYGNENNLTTAVKNSPLTSFIFGIVLKGISQFLLLDTTTIIQIVSLLITLFSALSMVFFYDTVKSISTLNISIVITALFFSNRYILETLLKISSEALGFFLLIFWFNRLYKFSLTNEYHYFFTGLLASSLFYSSRYQLLFLHIFAILLSMFICKKHKFSYKVLFIPTMSIFANFYFNWIRSGSVFGHPAGVEGDTFKVLIHDLIILLKRTFLIPNLPFNKLLVTLILLSTFYYLSKFDLTRSTLFSKLLIPNVSFEFLISFTTVNIALLLITLRVNKVDTLSFRYFIYNLFFIFLIISYLCIKNKILFVYIGALLLFNITTLNLSFENSLKSCYCSDLSIETIEYINKNLRNENILGSRFSSQIYYSDFQGKVFLLPFYSEYNKSYGRLLQLDEAGFKELIAEEQINYIVFFEGNDKNDSFIENNLYGDFIESIYSNSSIYVDNIIDLSDGKVLKLKK